MIAPLEAAFTPGDCVTVLKNILYVLNEKLQIKDGEAIDQVKLKEKIQADNASGDLHLFSKDETELIDFINTEEKQFGVGVIDQILVAEQKFDETLMAELIDELKKFRDGLKKIKRKDRAELQAQEIFKRLVTQLRQIEESVNKEEIVLVSELDKLSANLSITQAASSRNIESIRNEILMPLNDIESKLPEMLTQIKTALGLARNFTEHVNAMETNQQQAKQTIDSSTGQSTTANTAANLKQLIDNEANKFLTLLGQIVDGLNNIYPKFIQAANQTILFTQKVFVIGVTDVNNFLTEAEQKGLATSGVDGEKVDRDIQKKLAQLERAQKSRFRNLRYLGQIQLRKMSRRINDFSSILR